MAQPKKKSTTSRRPGQKKGSKQASIAPAETPQAVSDTPVNSAPGGSQQAEADTPIKSTFTPINSAPGETQHAASPAEVEQEDSANPTPGTPVPPETIPETISPSPEPETPPESQHAETFPESQPDEMGSGSQLANSFHTEEEQELTGSIERPIPVQLTDLQKALLEKAVGQARRSQQQKESTNGDDGKREHRRDRKKRKRPETVEEEGRRHRRSSHKDKRRKKR